MLRMFVSDESHFPRLTHIEPISVDAKIYQGIIDTQTKREQKSFNKPLTMRDSNNTSCDEECQGSIRSITNCCFCT